MEVASMFPQRVPENYNLHHQHYPQYHDMRTPQNPSISHSPAHSGYSHYHQTTPTAYQTNHATPSADDANRPSLPSITNLLVIADGDRGSQHTSESHSPSRSISQQTENALLAPEQCNGMAYPLSTEHFASQRAVMPPTPPLRSDSIPEGARSPSTISSAHSPDVVSSYQLGSSLNNVDAAQQRVFVPMAKPPVMAPQPMYNTSPYGMNPYITSPSVVSSGSYYSPEQMYQTNMYQQRPLLSNFPPTVMAAPVMPPGPISSANPWEHQHFITHGQASFPTVQDRYVCNTCKKAFSRPSSLKIHSHSHTGEKPFRCPHTGCGKAFSVRSNMKRHERGCHAGGAN